uniref:Amine oxidase domain-containing protein n=1 Tax=uncultured archaeon MedDCM-OCT-S08-C282 TaxID=743096 RepID=D6PBV1_9ARCH|nr:hypothetical protein [uncultured archaeon MedDCM-OCT-S08-C282]
MAAALDEVGVLIEAHCQVEAVENGRVSLKDGRTFDSDVVVLACGKSQAQRLLRPVDEEALAGISPIRASTLDATLTSRPLGEKHGLIDAQEGAYVFDLANIQPRLGLEGAFLSAVMVEQENETKEARAIRFEHFLEHHAKGWQHHVLHERRQENIVVQTKGQKPAYDAYVSNGILLAGEWVASDHELADAAAETGRKCGQNIA